MTYNDKLSEDATEVLAIDQASCQCVKDPPQCDCCVQFKVLGFPVKGNNLSTHLSCGQFYNTHLALTTYIIHRLRTIKSLHRVLLEWWLYADEKLFFSSLPACINTQIPQGEVRNVKFGITKLANITTGDVQLQISNFHPTTPGHTVSQTIVTPLCFLAFIK